MSDRVERARRAASMLDPAWHAAEIEAALHGLRGRRRRRLSRAGARLALAAAVAVIVAVGLLGRSAPQPPPATSVRRPAAEEGARPIRPETDEPQVGKPAAATRLVGPAPPRSERSREDRLPRWRALATGGDYDSAYRHLEPSQVRDAVEDLMLAADVARLSGHPRDAIAPLRRVIDGHASDPRRQIAAFTLGRVLLDELGDPRGAADAFGAARAAAPGGPLAEDALAREVESWSRAGEDAAAEAAAELYVGRYPAGRRLKAVRRFGGLDP